MKISEISIKGFRCYENIENIDFQDLTVFIGANDVGKTALARAIEVLLTAEKVISNEYYKSEKGEVSDLVTITGNFVFKSPNNIPERFLSDELGKVKIKKEISSQKNLCFFWGKSYLDDRFNTFQSQSALSQKDSLTSLGIQPAPNSEGRIQQFINAEIENKIDFKYDWVEVKFSEIELYLPIFDRVSSYEYQNPEVFIQNTLRQYIKDAFFDVDESGNQTLTSEIISIQDKIRERLNEKLSEMQGMLKKAEPRLDSVSVEPNFEFSKGVTTTNFLIKIGKQYRDSAVLGEGVKKKIWMGLLEWQMNSQKSTENRQVIRVYDEPDVNLDYHSERQFISSVISAVSENNLFQAVILTHSIALIDFLPINSIRMILQKSEGRYVDYFFDRGNDLDFKLFLESVNLNLGIKNSEIFFEKAFILVEGATEYETLPMLYKKLYNRNIEFDGIKIVNLGTCGAWDSVIKALLNNRHNRTLLFLDSDCQEESSSAKIIDRVNELNLGEDWLNNHVIFIGNKEFEDAFDSSFIADFLNFSYAKEDESNWTSNEIDQLKESSLKYSNDLLRLVKSTSKKENRNSTNKPGFGRKLADFYSTDFELPSEISKAFKKIRQLAGIEL
jgi:putative ATP-dependent endonuclease of the OLD family